MNLRKDHYWLTASGPARCLPFAAEGLPPPSPVRVSRGLRLARPPPEARALVWAWSPAGRTDGPAPPLRQSEPRCPDGLLRGPTEESRDCGSLEAGAGVPVRQLPVPARHENLDRKRGLAVSPWPLPARLRVPNSPPSCGGSTGGSMSPLPRLGGGRSARGFFFPFKPFSPSTNVATHSETKKKNKTNDTTLSGGSLGSCVDEERS